VSRSKSLAISTMNGSLRRVSRPGSWTEQTSISGGRNRCQVAKDEALPPAWAKQIKRNRAAGRAW